jgi:putative transposase
VSNLNKKIYGQIEAWRNQPIDGEQPYVYLDGIVLKRKRCSQATALRLGVVGYVQGSSSSRRLLGWPSTMRVMTSAR